MRSIQFSNPNNENLRLLRQLSAFADWSTGIKVIHVQSFRIEMQFIFRSIYMFLRLFASKIENKSVQKRFNVASKCSRNSISFLAMIFVALLLKCAWNRSIETNWISFVSIHSLVHSICTVTADEISFSKATISHPFFSNNSEPTFGFTVDITAWQIWC